MTESAPRLPTALWDILVVDGMGAGVCFCHATERVSGDHYMMWREFNVDS
jgi:hypothetical protein